MNIQSNHKSKRIACGPELGGLIVPLCRTVLALLAFNSLERCRRTDAPIERSSRRIEAHMAMRQLHFREMLSVVFAVISVSVSVATYGQTLQGQIIGTWVAVSQYVEQDGKRIEPFGADPKGMVVYDPNGRFILVLQRATLPKFASNNRMTGTADENRAIVQGTIAYFGRYSVDENERKINLHYDGSTFPNWDGQDQTRLVEISGDELKIISPVSAVGGGTVHLLLKRAK
jgi:Lipocalin-like domain